MSFIELKSERFFLGARRQNLLPYLSYSDQLETTVQAFTENTEEYVCSFWEKGICDLAAVMSAFCATAWDGVLYINLHYSAGEPVAKLAEDFPFVVSLWELYAKYDSMYDDSPEAGGRRVPHLDLYDSDYWRAIRLVSFAILLGHGDLLPRLAPIIDYENDDRDGLIERLLAPYLPNRGEMPDKCTRHLPYFKLLKVFDAEPDARPALMQKYMSEWYKASRREPYYEMHTPGGLHGFMGYWSFEAAAVTYLLDIDDSSYRDHEFYPRDMADFAREIKAPRTLTKPIETTLRGLPGQTVPKTGRWWTPALPPETRRQTFNEGDKFLGPDQTQYGAVIWYFEPQ